MSYVKISQLTETSNLNPNPGKSYFVTVDSDTGQTTKLNAKNFGTSLYANNVLYVGSGGAPLTNLVAQFTGIDGSFVQMSMENQNASGSADYVITADDGDNDDWYLDLGLNNSNFNDSNFSSMKAHDGYLYVHGPTGHTGSAANLVIGTEALGANIVFIAGGLQSANIVGNINRNSFNFQKDTYVTGNLTISNAIVYPDGSRQNIAANTTLLNANVAAVNTFTQAAFAVANTAVQNTAIIQLAQLNLSGNLIANSAGQGVFVDSFTSNSATFSKNMVVLGNLTANTLLGNIFFSNVVTTTTQSNSILWTTQAGQVTQQTAQLWYYGNTQSLILDTDIPGDRLSISKVLFFRGFNTTGATIPANSFIRLISGVTANQIPLIALADATSSANATVAGFVKVAIANGSYGFAYSQGIVEDLDTTGLGSTGDILFLSTIPGRASNVAPTGSANTVVQLGRIVNRNSTSGKVFIQNQLRQAYGRTDGSVLYALSNNITSSATVNINESVGRLNVSSTLYAANGIINRSFEYPSSQTAITINMTTDTWVKCNVGASLGVTLTGFTPGSEVVVIATNPASGGGSTRVITHGCSALNSSIGATDFILGATTTAFLKYYCFNGDLANTYVQVNYV